MSLISCGRATCTKRKIKHSVGDDKSKSLDASYDIIEEKVAVRGSEMAADQKVKTVYTVTDMEHNSEHYDLLTVIGKGCYNAATVLLAKHVPSDTLVAVKKVQMDKWSIDFNLLHHEQLMHRKLRHVNLLPSLCSFVHRNELWTVFPLMAFGSCRDLLHAHFNEGLPELAIAFVLRDILQALEYLHSRALVHRSIRASHVLVSATGQVALTGFRHVLPLLANGKRRRAVHDFPEHYGSSLLWASPELLEQNLAGYNTKSDIYSFGILACELANGVAPFNDMPMTQMLLEKLEGTTPRLLDSITIPEIQNMAFENGQCGENSTTVMDSGLGTSALPYQRTFSSNFHNFVELCLHIAPSHRPTATALLQHSFFRQANKRKSGQDDTLPDLLKPVSPLTTLDLSNLPVQNNDDTSVDELTEDMELAGIEDWSFDD